MSRLPTPLKTLQAHVDPREIARAYLRTELAHLFGHKVSDNLVADTVDNMDDTKLWHMTEGFANVLTQNYVFWRLTAECYEWREEMWLLDDVTLGGISPSIDAIVSAPTIGHSPVRFAAYLRDYFSAHPHDDPKGLAEFRPQGGIDAYSHVLLTESDGKIKSSDGSHRLMVLAQQGVQEVRAYVGYLVNDDVRYSMGDSIFVLLRNLYTSTHSAQERETIVQMIRLLLRHDTASEHAVQKWWVEYAEDDETREVGKRILDS